MALEPANAKRTIAIIAATLVVAALAVAAYLFLNTTAEIPTAFSVARNTGAESARILSESFATSLETLSEIAKFDRQGDTERAVFLVNKEIDQIRFKKERASDLANSLAQMAQAIPDIEPQEAREKAIEAVSAQLAAVGHLITYNEKLLELFDTLQSKFETGVNPPAGTVEALLKALNQEAKTINELNSLFSKFLKEFDSYFEEAAK